MSAHRTSGDNDHPVPRRSSFRKSDFVIRNKQDDSFSQIDSFKVTAKKSGKNRLAYLSLFPYFNVYTRNVCAVALKGFH